MRTHASDLSYDGHRVVERPIADDVATLDVVLALANATRGSTLTADFEAFARKQSERLM